MFVYRLVGFTAAIDWSSTSKPVHIGIYATREGAREEMKRRQEGRDWTMDWDRFVIHQDEVIGSPDTGWKQGDVDRQGGSFSDDEIIREFKDRW